MIPNPLRQLPAKNLITPEAPFGWVEAELVFAFSYVPPIAKTNPLFWAEADICVAAFTGCAFPWNDIVGVVSSFQ
jgi:hypothetical protein